MKLILPLITVATASLLAIATASGQTTAPPPAPAAKAKNPQHASSEAKQRAEDDALMQQLETSGPDVENGPKHPQNHWAGGAPAPAVLSDRLQTVIGRASSGAGKPLLVRTSEAEPKTQAALEEDLSVMTRILDKSIEELPGGQRRPRTALGIDVFFSPGSAPMRSIYLDNYGAVFFLNVGFPLIAPAEKHEDEKPAADSAWEDAKQELYGQHLQTAVAGEPAEDYSQEKVEKLKDTLLASLKNATNIRDLKPDEFVTLWVSGGNSGGAGRFRVVKHNARAAAGGNAWTSDLAAVPARRTILTVRVSKADIDAYAKGALSHEDFEKRARVTTYAGPSTAGISDVMVGEGFGFGGGTRF